MDLYAKIVMPPRVDDKGVNPLSRLSRFGTPRVELTDEDGNTVAVLKGIQQVSIGSASSSAGFIETSIQVISDVVFPDKEK